MSEKNLESQQSTLQFEQMHIGVERLFGKGSLSKLKNSHIAILGLGGVGSWCAEALVRSGVGKLTMVDMDEVCLGNTNRQLHTLSETIGRSKIAVLKERFEKITPYCQVNCIEDFYDKESNDLFFQLKYNLIIDAFDSTANKCLLASECRERSIPLIMVGSSGGKKDPTQIRTNDLGITGQDRLLMQTRKKLRRDYGFPPAKQLMGITAVYSNERAQYPDKDGNICHTPLPTPSGKLTCQNGLGTACFLTGSFGFASAYAAIKILLED